MVVIVGQVVGSEQLIVFRFLFFNLVVLRFIVQLFISIDDVVIIGVKGSGRWRGSGGTWRRHRRLVSYGQTVGGTVERNSEKQTKCKNSKIQNVHILDFKDTVSIHSQFTVKHVLQRHTVCPSTNDTKCASFHFEWKSKVKMTKKCCHCSFSPFYRFTTLLFQRERVRETESECRTVIGC